MKLQEANVSRFTLQTLLINFVDVNRTRICLFFFKAQQRFRDVEEAIKRQQTSYKLTRDKQRERLLSDETLNTVDDETFWKSTSEHAPETRIEISRRHRRTRGINVEIDRDTTKKSSRLFTSDGRPLNVNQTKLKFSFLDGNPEEYALDLHVYKLNKYLLDALVSEINSN